MRIAFDLRPVGAEYAGPRAILLGWQRGWTAAFPEDDVSLLEFNVPPSRLDVLRGKLGMVSPPADSWVVLCSPTVRSALGGSGRHAIVCHDFRHLEQPDRFTLLQRAFRSFIGNRAFQRAPIVLANSEQTRVELSKHIPTAVVHVVSWAPSATGIDAGGDRQSRAGLLAIAHRENKPPSRAVNAWHDAFPDDAHRPPLTVLAGDLVSTVEPEQGLTVRSKVTDEEYRRLFRESIAVLYLSDFEGLGLPCFEAMAAETPLVTSDLSIFRDNLGADYPGLANTRPDLVLRRIVEDESTWDACRSHLSVTERAQEQMFALQITTLRAALLARSRDR